MPVSSAVRTRKGADRSPAPDPQHPNPRWGGERTTRWLSPRDLAGPPPRCKPGDRRAARGYVLMLNMALERKDLARPERMKLYKAKAIWQARAEGRDARFEVVGNRPGRLHGQQRLLLQMKTRRKH